MNKRSVFLSACLCVFVGGAPSVFADVIVDPDNIEANRVFSSDPLVLGNFTGQIFVRFSGRDGVLEVNADSTVNGVTAISGSVLIHGRDGDSGTVRIIGNGTSGSARIDITEGVGLRNSLGGNGLLDIRNGGVLESHEQDIFLGNQGLGTTPGGAVTNVDGQGSILRSIQDTDTSGFFRDGGVINIGFDGTSQSTVNITNGELVEALGSSVGDVNDFGAIFLGGGGAGSVANINVAGEGSTLRASQFIEVGSRDSLTNTNVNITDGGRVEVSVGSPGFADVAISTLAG